MPDVEAFTDREDSAGVKEITRDVCDVYAAQLAADFQHAGSDGEIAALVDCNDHIGSAFVAVNYYRLNCYSPLV